MINRISTSCKPSFKSVYAKKDFAKMLSHSSNEKMSYVMQNIDSLFPANDFFFYSKWDDNVSCRIKVAHPMKLLAHPSVLLKFKDPVKVIKYASLAIALDVSGKSINKKKDDICEIDLGDITRVEQGDIMTKLLEKIVEFNLSQKYS